MSRTAALAGFLCAYGIVVTSAFGAMIPGVVGDGVADVYVNIGVPFGEVRFKMDGAVVLAYTLTSEEGIFTGEPANNPSSLSTDTNERISSLFPLPFNGEHILGTVIGQEHDNMTADAIAADLTVIFLDAQSSEQAGTLIIIPEPATLMPITLGALAVTRRRRKQSRN